MLPVVISLIVLFNSWHLIDNKHWQIESSISIPNSVIDSQEGNRGVCSEGMVEARGQMKQDPGQSPYGFFTVEELQKTTCTSWINRDFPERCAQFDRDRWLKISSGYATKPMNFCIDRFEYPNIKGQYPVIYVGYYEAQAMCGAQGKRLCNEEEWTFACEGDEATPYPYGYTRDANKCNIDKPWREYHASQLRPRYASTTMMELDRLWQGEPSGARPECKSSFGVYDMTGNVDEWTSRVRPGKYPSILKGGYWSRVRTRCRPSTRNHNENHIFYQQGFRCCSDAKDIK